MENGKVTTLKEFLDLEKTKETMEKVEEILDADAETVALIEKAESETDLYDVFKKYVTAPIEYTKRVFHEVTEYFKADKAVLSDETLDNVVGGWSFSNFWNKYKKVIIIAAVSVAATAAVISGFGAVLGGAIAGTAAIGSTVGVGAGIGALAGWCVGACSAGAVLLKANADGELKP